MAKRKHKKIKAVKGWPINMLLLIAITGAVVVFSYYYSIWRYNNDVSSLKKEYKEILNQERKILPSKTQGEVLSTIVERNVGRDDERIRLPIILYHYVEVVKDKGDTIRQSLNINPYIFEKQLKDLKDNGYTTYYVKDIPGILNGGIKTNDKSVVLTFDDGYEDFYTDAFPIIQKYKTKVTLYVVYDFIGRKGFLNKQELVDIAKSGLVEIGSHAVDHISMSWIATSEAKWQITRSKSLLEELLGIEITTFAYPYGGFNAITADFVKEASYSAAVSVMPGVYHTNDEIFHLTRYRAGMLGDSPVKVLEKLKK